jgi:hypothetical protein
MHPDKAIAALVKDQHGMVSRSQALKEGLTWEQIHRRRETGILLDVFPGVYRHAAVPLTWQGRVMGAVLVGGDGAAASHRSAARIEAFHDVPPSRPEITVSTLDLPIHSGIHVHRTNLLAAADVVVVDRIRCTAPPRTCLDLGAVLPYELVEPIVQDAVIRKLVTHQDLLAVLERVGGRGRRGTAALRAIVHGALPDEHIESELERLLLALFPPDHGFTLQYEMTCSDGRRVRLDAARPDFKIAVEANGHRWHSTAKQMNKDMARRRSIQASGWELWEYGWADTVETPDVVRAELAALVARCQ